MKLYHGTTEWVALKAITEGLKPRGERRSVWKDAPSRPDAVYLTESPDGYRLTPYNPEFESQMDAARKIMKKRRAALRELAK